MEKNDESVQMRLFDEIEEAADAVDTTLENILGGTATSEEVASLHRQLQILQTTAAILKVAPLPEVLERIRAITSIVGAGKDSETHQVQQLVATLERLRALIFHLKHRRREVPAEAIIVDSEPASVPYTMLRNETPCAQEAEQGVPLRLLETQEALNLIRAAGLSRQHRRLYLLINNERAFGDLVRLQAATPREVESLLEDLAQISIIQLPPSRNE